MDKRSWNILCWNIRGINASSKWDAVQQKIEEIACAGICLQETKRESFDSAFIWNFAPRRFDKFSFFPSVGLSGGLLVLWNSSIFLGNVVVAKPYTITIDFTTCHDRSNWRLTSVYGTCHEPLRSEFVHWLRNLDLSGAEHWLFVGDFNFYRSLQDRNRPGGNLNDTLIFNDIIGHLGLVEIPLKGRAFTWSNMQQSPLLEQLD